MVMVSAFTLALLKGMIIRFVKLVYVLSISFLL